MKHVIYSCDWCGVREPEDTSTGECAWPEGWTIIDDPQTSAVIDELMCRACVLEVRKALANVREQRLALRGVQAEEIR